MKYRDLDELLSAMLNLDQTAFENFDETLREEILDWLVRAGLSVDAARKELPGCIFHLSLYAVQCAGEIKVGRFREWLHVATRAYAVRYWMTQPAPHTNRIPAAQLRLASSRLDGNRENYLAAAKLWRVPPRWIRKRHRRILLGIRSGNISAFNAVTG